MQKCLKKETSLALLSIVNLPLVVSAPIFMVFLPTTNKFSMIYTLAFRCFSICSNWTNFHNELAFLKDIFLKSAYPVSFIDKCFKTFLDQLYLKKPPVLTAEKRTLKLVLPFLGELSV